jgi:hypothetical protein
MVSVNSLSGISGAYQSLIQQQRAKANAAFGSDDRAKSMESNAAAYSLYNKPGLLTGLTRWDGSAKPASQRVKAADVKSTASDPKKTVGPPPRAGTKTGTGRVIAAPTYSFNPFDQKTWDVKASKGNNVDALS